MTIIYNTNLTFSLSKSFNIFNVESITFSYREISEGMAMKAFIHSTLTPLTYKII